MVFRSINSSYWKGTDEPLEMYAFSTCYLLNNKHVLTSSSMFSKSITLMINRYIVRY